MSAALTLPTFPASTPTLGWGVVEWIENYLHQPDGDLAGEPFTLTDEQLRFVLWWYAVDKAGRFVYRRGVLRRAKGWGKSPFMGALCLAELCGPVRFSHWDGDAPMGRAESMAWVVVAGVSETQAENTLGAIRSMAEGAPVQDAYGLDIGLTRIYSSNGGKIVPVTASAATQEGARPTFAVLDETHHWTKSNGGAKLAAVIRRNLAKRPGGTARAVETTNAHGPGDESVAEASYLSHLAASEGRSRTTGILYDSREAPAGIALSDEPALLAGLRDAYGDAIWVDLDRILGEIYDTDTSPEEARRFYLNQIVAAADAWVSPDEWLANINKDLPPLAAGEEICLGFDGGLTDDSSALVAVRISDGAPFLLGIWEKPEGPQGVGWQVDKDAVRGVVANAFLEYDPVAFFSDVAYWETDVDAWRDEYAERLLIKATTRHAVGWDMRGHQAETVRSVEALHRAILDRQVPHDGQPRLSRHVINARKRPGRWGITFGKETRESPNKVDALAALMLARMARTRVLGEGVLKKRRKRTGRLVGF